MSTDEYLRSAPMTTAARISLALAACFFLAGVMFASPVVTHKRTVQEIGFWEAAGCDEVCLLGR
jgi:hypothetical protein